MIPSFGRLRYILQFSVVLNLQIEQISIYSSCSSYTIRIVLCFTGQLFSMQMSLSWTESIIYKAALIANEPTTKAAE